MVKDTRHVWQMGYQTRVPPTPRRAHSDACVPNRGRAPFQLQVSCLVDVLVTASYNQLDGSYPFSEHPPKAPERAGSARDRGKKGTDTLHLQCWPQSGHRWPHHTPSAGLAFRPSWLRTPAIPRNLQGGLFLSAGHVPRAEPGRDNGLCPHNDP